MYNVAGYIESILRESTAGSVTNIVIFILIGAFVFALVSARKGVLPGYVHYAPNLLTSLGILGTFIGIVIGLLGFDVNNIDGSIGPLLEGLKTAFITSLVGMALAIIFKTLDSSDKLHKQVEEGQIQHVGPEEIYTEIRAQRSATEQLTRSIAGDEDSALISQIRLLRSDVQEQSKSTLEQLSAQVSLQEAISVMLNTQQERFEAFSTDLWKKLDEFAEMLSKSATEQVINALKEVIADFNQNLTEQFGENFKELNAAVEKLVHWQDNYREQLAQMIEQYSQGVQAITQTEASVAHISEESKQIPVAMDSLKTVLETTQHQLNELERHLEAFRDMRDKAVEAVPQIQEQMDSMVKDVSTAVKDAGEQIMTASQAVNTAIVEGAKEFEDRVHRTNEGLTNASDQLANNSQHIREQLEDTMKDINEHVRNLLDDMKNNANAIGEQLIDANKNLEASIKEVQYQVTDSIESMQQRLESVFNQIVQEQSNSLARAHEAFEGELGKSIATTGEAVNKQLEAMDQAMQQEMERVMNAMGQSLAAISNRFTEDYSALTERMTQIVDQARRAEGRAGFNN